MGADASTRLRRGWRRALRRPPAVAGALVVLAFAGVALAAPWIATSDPVQTNWSQIRKAPSFAHPFGTDDLGRDTFSRVIWGTRISMQAGVLSILLAMAIGVPAGFVAGYYRGVFDQLIMRLTDAWLSFPFLILAIGLGATPLYIRLTRGLVLATEAHEYVQGARAMGAGDARVMARHIFPNILSALLVQATVSIPTAIIAEAILSFLGLGVQPPRPSWGTMLNAAQQFLDSAPWMAWWPGLAIFTLTLSFNLAGDGLRDWLDPRDY